MVTTASGGGEKGMKRLMYRTLGGPKNLPEVVQKVEMLDAVKNTLPVSMYDVVDELKEILIDSLISTTSVKGAFLTLLTTQKSEFKINDPNLRRNLSKQILSGGGDGGYE